MSHSNKDPSTSFLWHLAILMIILLSLHACLEIQATDEGDMSMLDDPMPSSSDMMTDPITINDTVLQSSLLIRVLPAQNVQQEAQIFCEAVAIQPTLLLSSAYCFRNGVHFAEVYTGEQINIMTPSTPAVSVKSYYIHEDFQANSNQTFDNNIALVELVSAAPTSVLQPLANIESANLESFIRVGYTKIDLQNFRRTVQVMFPESVEMNEIIFGSPDDGLCSIGGGATVADYEGDIKLVAINHKGNNSPCISGGTALRVDLHKTWIEQSVAQLASNSIGQDLLCAQALLCHDHNVQCNQSIRATHRNLFDELFLCANAQQCNSVQCYSTVCAEEYSACVNAQ